MVLTNFVKRHVFFIHFDDKTLWWVIQFLNNSSFRWCMRGKLLIYLHDKEDVVGINE